MFNGYYNEQTRHNFIQSALGDSTSIKILPRHNVLSSHPSDFDVIRVFFHVYL